MFFKETRVELEKRMVGVMIEMYCQKRHEGGGGLSVAADALCPECAALYSYAQRRLDKCVFQNEKPTCGNCPIHCYKPDMRRKVKLVMRYAGPRMFYKHPMLAILHAVEGMWKRKPLPGPDKNNAKSSGEKPVENNEKGAP
jgi:hypothetical protein